MNELDLLVENYFTDSFEASDLFRLVEQAMDESEENPCAKFPNRGEVAEGIVAAALAAKFAKRIGGKIGNISSADIQTVIGRIEGQGIEIITDVEDFPVDGRVQVSDNVYLSISMGSRAFKALVDPNKLICLQGEYDGAVAYVNEEYMTKFATRLASNQKANKILVQAAGTKDQKGTKVDIFLNVDGGKVRKQISLKVEGGDQFAQKGGREFKHQQQFWDHLGIDISNAEGGFDAIMSEVPIGYVFDSREDIDKLQLVEKTASALTLTYKEAFEQLGEKLNGDVKEEAFMKKLISFIREGATGKDAEFIELVKIQPGSFKRARFGKQFEQTIRNMNLFARYHQDGLYPQIYIDARIQDETTGETKEVPIVRFRGRAGRPSNKAKTKYGVYVRNYIESRDGLYELAKI